MRYLQILAATLAAVTIAGCSPTTESTTAPASQGVGDDNPAVDAIFAAWDVPGSPGCGLAVADNGELHYTRGYGYANLDYDIPITPDTIFDIASVTKQFTAASIMLLVEEGKLSLDDEIQKWLPELPTYEWPITLRHMLQHASGLRDYLALFPLAGRNDYFPISHPQILDMMSRQRALVFPPGERMAYSNTAFMLLAQVVERVSGQSFGSFAKERIFEPLGMSRSFMYDDFGAIIPDRSIGYFNAEDGSVRIVHNYNFDVAGDGQMYTTMGDLLIWDNYLHGEQKPGIYALMREPGMLTSGETLLLSQGLRRGEYRGQTTIGHSGSSWGFRTELVRFEEAGLTIAISCNMDNVRPGELAEAVADVYLEGQLDPRDAEEESVDTPDQESEAAPVITLSAEALAEFAGVYYSPELDAIYRLNLVDGALMLRIEQEAGVAALPLGSDVFEALYRAGGWSEPATLKLEFDRNRAGSVIGFGLTMGSSRDIVFEKGGVR